MFIGLDKDTNPEEYDKVKNSLLHTPLRIIDIAVDNSGFLILPPSANCIVDVRDMSDVDAWFECNVIDYVLIPPDKDEINKIGYLSEILMEIDKRRQMMIDHKCDENSIIEMPKTLFKMAIMSSLKSGKVNNDIYFQYAK